MGIEFENDPLTLEQSNYLTKVVNVYIVYDLEAWPKVLLDNFKLKNYLFGTTRVVKSSIKEKQVDSGYEIVFDGGGLWSFGNDSTKNVIIFGVDNSSSSHSNNHKNNLLILGEGPTFGNNGNFGSPAKNFWY